MRRLALLGIALAFCAISFGIAAQEREDRTLLPWEQMRAIINEASGERATTRPFR